MKLTMVNDNRLWNRLKASGYCWGTVLVWIGHYSLRGLLGQKLSLLLSITFCNLRRLYFCNYFNL